MRRLSLFLREGGNVLRGYEMTTTCLLACFQRGVCGERSSVLMRALRGVAFGWLFGICGFWCGVASFAAILVELLLLRYTQTNDLHVSVLFRPLT